MLISEIVWKVGSIGGAAVWLVLQMLAAVWSRSLNSNAYETLGKPLLFPSAIGTLRFLYGRDQSLDAWGSLWLLKWVMAVWLPTLLLWLFGPNLGILLLE